MKQEVEGPAVEDDDAVKQVDGTLSWSVTETDPTGRKRRCNQAKATRTADNAASLAPARNDASVEDVSVESNPVLTRHRFVRSAERGGSMKQIVGSGAERIGRQRQLPAHSWSATVPGGIRRKALPVAGPR